MYELEKRGFGKVLPIFEGIDDNRPAIFAVIEGNNVGRIFVDDREKPTTALICAGFCYLAGNEKNTDFNNELKSLLVTEFMPTTPHLLIFSFSDEWRDVLDELLKDYGVTRISRHIFDFDSDLFLSRHEGWRERIPEGYHVEKVDRRLAEKIPGLAEMWASVENFLSRGFGFDVMKGDEIISSCRTVFVGDGRAEISIETEEKYRRQGFGTLSACAFIEHSLEKGLLPEWACFDNQASERLAEKLGFVRKPDVQVNYVRVKNP